MKNQNSSSTGYLRSSTTECPSAGVDPTEVISIEDPHLFEDLEEPWHDLRPACSGQV